MDQDNLTKEQVRGPLNLGRKFTIGGAGLGAICAVADNFRAVLCVTAVTLILATYQFILDYRKKNHT